MAQHDYVIDNSTGANVRADINNVLQAIATNNSGSSAPSTTYASQFFADTTAGIMKLRNTANNGYVNLFTLAGGLDVDSASNFNEDVTFTGASANIVFDKSDNQLEFADNAKAEFGTGGDLQIYHDGTTNQIISGTGADIRIGTSGEAYALFKNNGAVELYHDNSKKFETKSTGGQITGQLQLGDGAGSAGTNMASFGNSDDLKIYHNSTDSVIDNETGDLYVQSDDQLILKSVGTTEIRKHSGDELMIKAVPDGAVELYYDNSKKFETTSSGATATGNFVINNTGGTAGKGELSFGSSGRPFIEAFDSGNHGSGAAINFRTGAGDYMAKMKFDGAVELYHDNSKKLDTTSTGVGLHGLSTGAGNSDLRYNSSTGQVTYDTSTILVKENIQEVPYGLDIVNQLQPKIYERTDDNNKIELGFIAEEMQKLIPEIVPKIKGLPVNVDYRKVCVVLTKAIQELSVKVAALEAA
jgi:hypothetical protein